MADKLEKRIDRLEKFVKDQQETIQDLKSELKEEKMGPPGGKNQPNSISRRSFLKKLGAGAAGLGALSLAPAASQLKITKNGISSDTGFNFFDSGSQYFKINNGGPVEVKNTNLSLNNGMIEKNDPGSGSDLFYAPSNNTAKDFRQRMYTYDSVTVDGTNKLLHSENSKTGIYIVKGQPSDGTSGGFTDIVVAQYKNTVIAGGTERYNAPSRSYSAGSTWEFYINMSGGDFNNYDLTLHFIG